MDKHNILIVDDSALNRKILNLTLSENYNILEAENGIEAISIINKFQNTLSLILLDIMMPELNGIEVLKIIKSNPKTATIPVILITAADSNEEYAFELGAVDFISKPFNSKVVKSRVDTQINIRDYIHSDSNKNFLEIATGFKTAFVSFVEILVNIINSRNLNSKNIASLNKIAVEKMLNYLKDKMLIPSTLDCNFSAIISAVSLRDIGKIMISDSILLKKEPLTPDEFGIIKKHTQFGFEIIQKMPPENMILEFKITSDICLYHHENWDGSGYPYGLKNTNIPFYARLSALFDCYEAMIEDKPYRKAFSHQQAIDFIKEQKGIKFDPTLTDAFICLEKDFEQIYFNKNS